MVASVHAIPDPPPMREVQPAKMHLRDAYRACDRISRAWNKTQMEDALRSLRFYLEKMEKAL